MRERTGQQIFVFLAMLAIAIHLWGAAEIPEVLPDPDGKPADMSKPVKVFILMGQSNMLGFGNAGQLKGIAGAQYPYLVDDAGNWIVRQDVRNVFFCMGKLRYNDWLTAENGNGSGKFGPEIGIGNYLGHVIDAPVLILKSCVGNRALGWDLLPPSAVGTGVGGKSYQGDSDSSNRKVKENSGGWYAGLQYDQDVGAAQDALKNLSTYYPGAKEYEVAGFFWWQGNAEQGKGSVENYDKNLAFLFNDLRKDFNAPNAKFVCATLGEHDKSATLSQKMFDFAGRPEFKDQAAVFYTKPVSKGGGSGGHYSGNAETYMNVGEGMGRAMAKMLLEKSPGSGGSLSSAKSEPEKRKARKLAQGKEEVLQEMLFNTLVKLSDAGRLKPVTVPVSFTRAKVYLVSVRPDHTLTFGSGPGKTAEIEPAKLMTGDYANLAVLASQLSPDSSDALALAGAYLEVLGRMELAEKKYAEAGAESTAKMDVFFEQ